MTERFDLRPFAVETPGSFVQGHLPNRIVLSAALESPAYDREFHRHLSIAVHAMAMLGESLKDIRRRIQVGFSLPIFFVI